VALAVDDRYILTIRRACMATDPELQASEIAGRGGSTLPDEASEAEEQALLEDIARFLPASMSASPPSGKPWPH
jgi:hypothetical protein